MPMFCRPEFSYHAAILYFRASASTASKSLNSTGCSSDASATGMPAVIGFSGYSPPAAGLPPRKLPLSIRFAATTF